MGRKLLPLKPQELWSTKGYGLPLRQQEHQRAMGKEVAQSLVAWKQQEASPETLGLMAQGQEEHLLNPEGN